MSVCQSAGFVRKCLHNYTVLQLHLLVIEIDGAGVILRPHGNILEGTCVTKRGSQSRSLSHSQSISEREQSGLAFKELICFSCPSYLNRSLDFSYWRLSA